MLSMKVFLDHAKYLGKYAPPASSGGSSTVDSVKPSHSSSTSAKESTSGLLYSKSSSKNLNIR